MSTVYVLNGPNLNLLGKRQPEIYGRETLDDVEAACAERAGALGLTLSFHQSNHEGEIVETDAAAHVQPLDGQQGVLRLRGGEGRDTLAQTPEADC